MVGRYYSTIGALNQRGRTTPTTKLTTAWQVHRDINFHDWGIRLGRRTPSSLHAWELILAWHLQMLGVRFRKTCTCRRRPSSKVAVAIPPAAVCFSRRLSEVPLGGAPCGGKAPTCLLYYQHVKFLRGSPNQEFSIDQCFRVIPRHASHARCSGDWRQLLACLHGTPAKSINLPRCSAMPWRNAL